MPYIMIMRNEVLDWQYMEIKLNKNLHDLLGVLVKGKDSLFLVESFIQSFMLFVSTRSVM